MLVPVPEPLRKAARLSVDTPAGTRDAATIAVVRDGDGEGGDGIEVFLMRRQPTMAFAAGMYVFPGGGVQASDAEPLEWVGPSADWFADRFGCDPGTARALVVAAVRETFEEVGVLLAGPDEHTVVADTTGYGDARARLEAKELGFAQFLADEGLVLRADLIGPWAHWITPAFEPRRFDTRFFVAALPVGQRIEQVSGEADLSGWEPLAQVLARVDEGEPAMLPPTARTCRQLAQHSAATILQVAADRTITPIEPTLVEVDGELFLQTADEEDQPDD